MTGLKGIIVVCHRLDMNDQVFKIQKCVKILKKIVKMLREIQKAGEYHLQNVGHWLISFVLFITLF